MDLRKRFESKFIPEPNSGCWLWTGTMTYYGYGQVTPNRFAHRVSWELYRGKIPGNLCVLHRCDTKLCVNPDHLFLGTRTDNAADRDQKGRTVGGEQHGMAKLTAQQVNLIRSSNDTHLAVAKKFGVSRQLVGFIKNNKRWKINKIEREG